MMFSAVGDNDQRFKDFNAIINKHFPIPRMDGYLPPWPPMPQVILNGVDAWDSHTVSKFGEQMEQMAHEFFSTKITRSLGLKIAFGRPNDLPMMPICDHVVGVKHLYGLEKMYVWFKAIWTSYRDYYESFVPPPKEKEEQ